MADDKQTSGLELIEESDMPPEIDATIKRLLCECFCPDAEKFSRSRYWHGSAPAYTLIHRDGDEVVGQVGIVLRTIRCGHVPTDIAGIQSLAVSPRIRGGMLAWALMRRSMKEARKRGVPFGLLFCVPSLERLYAAMRWERIDVITTMRDEKDQTVPIPGKNIAMVLKLDDRPFPEGDIDLQGADW
ncbi:MAG: GNAT family N-acetyltransferase [Planctomycetes bacterium]|nr:GNAT family N-acetyltransferase [Planctomycetota bacterium]